MKSGQKIWAGPSPPLIWTKSKRTATFFRETFPKSSCLKKRSKHRNSGRIPSLIGPITPGHGRLARNMNNNFCRKIVSNPVVTISEIWSCKQSRLFDKSFPVMKVKIKPIFRSFWLLFTLPHLHWQNIYYEQGSMAHKWHFHFLCFKGKFLHWIFSQRRTYFEQIKSETYNIFVKHI